MVNFYLTRNPKYMYVFRRCLTFKQVIYMALIVSTKTKFEEVINMVLLST
uniref:Uncharacterized protein n=1 Tax=Lepeophtheirus salmonis TaxID=72036 RepID=A0A0K2UDV1_LEPSM